MFQGEEIQKLVELLKERDAYLYHACQLLDFKSYLNVGGIPSRSHLESNSQPYTPFKTDQNDRANDDWDKVFANLSDFGFTFAGGYDAVPNIYGPILFQIKPEVFYEATDVAICLRSAGRNDFDREREALKSISEVDRLFKHPVDEPDKSKRSYVKTRKELEKDFTNASAPEISCTVESGKFSLEYVKLVRVEPYIIQGHHLEVKVKEIISKSGENLRVYKRTKSSPYTNELLKILESGVKLLQDISENSNVSEELRDWAKRVINRGIASQFNESFAPYLYNGTILPIIQGKL
ncbi:hypothetical protein [Microcoleus sp. Pol12B4]|uniref:hypothetical protein n=1 Tax=Microcoleus sp. Pol12B4 TaxID=3055395 RepID=UPI002FD60571